jgi:hypothetical protein
MSGSGFRPYDPQGELVDWIYSLQRMPLGKSAKLIPGAVAANTQKFQLIRNVGHLAMPIVFALSLRFVDQLTGNVVSFPGVPWKCEFGTQDGGITANLLEGRHSVFGDTLVVNSPAHADLPGGTGTIIAIASAAPNPGATVAWTEI